MKWSLRLGIELCEAQDYGQHQAYGIGDRQGDPGGDIPHPAPADVEEIVQRRLERGSLPNEENIWPEEQEEKLWPATFSAGE